MDMQVFGELIAQARNGDESALEGLRTIMRRSADLASDEMLILVCETIHAAKLKEDEEAQ